MQSISVQNGIIETPLGTSFGICYKPKKGLIKIANIIKSDGKYVAIFDENDVDFFIRINNRNDERDCGFQFTVDDDQDYRFGIASNGSASLKTLSSVGRYFHFVCGTSETSDVPLNEMAHNSSISPGCSDSDDRMAIFKCKIDYSVKLNLRLLVVTFTGHRIAIRCFGDDKIERIKQRIRERVGIPIKLQSLIFAEQLLDDARTLSEYHIQNDSTLQMALCLRSGHEIRIRRNMAIITQPKEDESGAEGVVGFGRKTKQTFTKAIFKKDTSIQIEPFLIELRLKK